MMMTTGRVAVFALVPALMAGGCTKDMQADVAKKGPLYAVFQTSMGDIKCRLFEAESPETVKNFVGLALGKKEWRLPGTEMWVKKPLYDGTIFHRVIPEFMIQGGDPAGNGSGGPGYRFADEFHPSLAFNKPGLLAMANAGRNTNGSQFFITEGTPEYLNKRHTIFGECGNLDVVKGIARVERHGGQGRGPSGQTQLARMEAGQPDKPVNDVVLKHVQICRGGNPCVDEK
jgi:peptidyl-prolyl cis-trans isomerase A (cyclophilin A)